MPRVTVIIPVYNVEKYLDQCLESVVGQTFSDIEIIVINDGSTDGSEEKCLEWARRDSRIIYVSKTNEKVGPTRNMGIRMASCEYLAFIDSDDWYDNRYIELLYGEAEQSGADVTICGYYEYNDTAKEAKQAFCPDSADMENVFISYPPSICIKLFKKRLFIDNDILMPGFVGEDAAIHGFIVTKANKVALVRQPLYYYRIKRIGSDTFSYTSYTKDTVKFLSYHCELFNRDNSFDKYKDLLFVYSLIHIKYWENVLKQNNVDYSLWQKSVLGFIKEYFPEHGVNDLSDIQFTFGGNEAGEPKVSDVSQIEPSIQNSAAHEKLEQLERETAELKKAIVRLIYNGETSRAAQILASYEQINPSDPEIGSLKKMLEG